MFYQCPKCKKVWQYPVGKCPECFLELERVKSNPPKFFEEKLGRVKVVGISRVTIPTMFHPKIPYFVLLLEDEKGNKWVQKSIKEYKIGDLCKVEPCTDRSTVAIWRIKYDILEGIEKVVEFLGGINVNQNSKILILPTLISPKHPYFAENTSPQFLESTIKYLTEKGVKLENIKVAGQSFDEIPIEVSVQKSQLFKVCQDYKIMPLSLAKTNFVKLAPYHPAPLQRGGAGAGKTEGQFMFEISEEVFNSDLIINLPILKMGKTSASENILKFLKKESYLGLKYLYSDEEVIENLNKALPQYLTLAEAKSVQKPDQFISYLGLILASFDPLNLDRVFAEVTLAKDLPELLKKIKIENISVIGRRIEELQFEAEKY